jgi:hypothetical protein
LRHPSVIVLGLHQGGHEKDQGKRTNSKGIHDLKSFLTKTRVKKLRLARLRKNQPQPRA